jgi:NAD(P)-dependent dehydrogenase (short-subunit alcohol dehydrogenase family)
MRLEGKVAVVTGAGSGMGRAIAMAFAKEGAKVVLGELVEESGKETEQMIKEAGGQAIFVKTDVSKAADIDKLVSTAVQEFGKLDIMVNNAGLFDNSVSCLDATEELYDRIMSVNLKGVFLGCRRALQEMTKQHSGKIINTSSVAGINGIKGSGGTIYTASKHGVVGITRQVACEVASLGINVNAICPGSIVTNMTRDLLNVPEMREAIVSSIPMKHVGQPEDIAQAAVFLASDESNYITGTTLVVDGGWSAGV